MVVMKNLQNGKFVYFCLFIASEINKASMSKWSFTYFIIIIIIIRIALCSDIIAVSC